MYTTQELLSYALDHLEAVSESEINDRLSFDSATDLQKAIDCVYAILAEVEESEIDSE